MTLRFFKFLPLLILTFLIACANPMSAVQKDGDEFTKKNPDHQVSFAGKNQKMNYVWNGDPHKRPVVFVHGSPGSWDAWADFLTDPELLKNFQLISVDRPGYGGSDEGKTETSLRKQAEDIFAVLEENQSGLAPILVGHSFGGPVIARMAMDFPRQIGGVIFVASSVSPDLEKTKWFQYPASWWPIRVLIPTELRVCNEEIFALKGELTQMLPGWSSIRAQSIVIQGDDDDLVPPANADFLQSHLPPDKLIQVERVPGLNHFIPWKRPDLIKTAILLMNQHIDRENLQDRSTQTSTLKRPPSNVHPQTSK